MLATNQKTINKPIKLNGVGLHNGVNAELIIKPAPENFGIKFCRVDIDKNDLIPANFKIFWTSLCATNPVPEGAGISFNLTEPHLPSASKGIEFEPGTPSHEPHPLLNLIILNFAALIAFSLAGTVSFDLPLPIPT